MAKVAASMHGFGHSDDKHWARYHTQDGRYGLSNSYVHAQYSFRKGKIRSQPCIKNGERSQKL